MMQSSEGGLAVTMLDRRRLVLAAERFTGSNGSGLANGFRVGGWSVHEIDPQVFCSEARSPASRLARWLVRPVMIKAYNDAILAAIEQVRPQAFVTVKGTFIADRTLRRMSQLGVVAVNFYPDFHFDHRGFKVSSLPLYDLVVTTKSFQLDFLRQRVGAERVAFVHHGYCDLVHFPHAAECAEERYRCDVFYVGNYSEHKEAWLRAVARRLPGLRLRIAGGGWDRAQDEAVRACAVGHVLTGDFFAHAVQASRINIAVHWGPSRREAWQDLVSTRTFEIPACKGFMLHVDNPEVRDLFEPGREIDVFANEDELIAKIEHYLARPAVRREMIERAYRRCVPAYGYNARAEDISRLIMAQLVPPTERGIAAQRPDAGAARAA